MIAEIVLRLTGAPFRQSGGATDLPESDEQLKVVPAVFVLPAVDQAGENQLASGGICQNVKPTFDVLIALSRKGAPSSVALDPLEELKGAVMDKLLGWSHSADYAPFEYAGGALMKISKSVLWWRMSFRTEYFLRKV